MSNKFVQLTDIQINICICINAIWNIQIMYYVVYLSCNIEVYMYMIIVLFTYNIIVFYLYSVLIKKLAIGLKLGK